MSGKLVITIGGWELKRWEYDGAPLVAEKHDWSIEIVDGDELQIDLDCKHWSDRCFLPLEALRQMLADYDARKRGEKP